MEVVVKKWLSLSRSIIYINVTLRVKRIKKFKEVCCPQVYCKKKMKQSVESGSVVQRVKSLFFMSNKKISAGDMKAVLNLSGMMDEASIIADDVMNKEIVEIRARAELAEIEILEMFASGQKRFPTTNEVKSMRGWFFVRDKDSRLVSSGNYVSGIQCTEVMVQVDISRYVVEDGPERTLVVEVCLKSEKGQLNVKEVRVGEFAVRTRYEVHGSCNILLDNHEEIGSPVTPF